MEEDGPFRGWKDFIGRLNVNPLPLPLPFIPMQPNKQLERGWAVIYNTSNPSKVPSIAFFVDNRKEKSVMKREKIDLASVRGVTRMIDHPKHPHCFTLKMKGSKQLILNADSA